MASILRSDIVPCTYSSAQQALHAILTQHTAAWVQDGSEAGLCFFIARSPADAFRWFQQHCNSNVKEALDALCHDEDSDQGSDYGTPITTPPHSPAKDPTTAISISPSNNAFDASAAESEPIRSRPKRARTATISAPQPGLTVGNKNGARERKRRKKLAQELSAAFVNSDEDNSDVDAAFTRENGMMFAWLGKQPPCRGMGHRAAAVMLRKALAVGGWEAFENWKVVLTHWRAAGTLNTAQHPPTSSIPPSSTERDIGGVLQGFRTAFLAAAGAEAAGILQDIMYRHLLAHLYACYQEAETLLLSTAGSLVRTRGVGNASIVRVQLYRTLYPSAPQGSENGSSKLYRHFIKRLEKGRRWWSIRSKLGYGIFALIPCSVVPHSWVERLPADQFVVWVDLVERYNTSAVEFAASIAGAVQDALEGRQPPASRLVLEEMEEDDLKRLKGSDLPKLLEPYEDDCE